MARPKKEEQTMSDNKDLHPMLQKQFDSGIPVKIAAFKQAVNNGYNVPENQFYVDSDNKNRQVEMRYTSEDLFCFQNGIFFAIPKSSIKYVHFI